MIVRYSWASTCSFSRIISSTFRSMDKSRQVAARFEEIDAEVKSLKEKLRAFEQFHYEKVLLQHLEQRNKALQDQVQKAVEELNSLERTNGSVTIPTTVLAKEADTSAPVSAPAPAQSPAPAAQPQGKQPKENKKTKAEAKEKADSKPKEAKKSAAAQEEGPVDVGRLDMRVGKIVEIKKHPDADALYVEQVDIGKPALITVVSGLVKHVPIEEMQNRLVVILCNLKPAKMRGITSEGMVMCASSPEKVEVLRPPPSCVPGDLITVPGYERAPDAVMNPKKKIFETVAPDLKTDSDLCATYKGAKWVVEGKGHITADSLEGVNVK